MDILTNNYQIENGNFQQQQELLKESNITETDISKSLLNQYLQNSTNNCLLKLVIEDQIRYIDPYTPTQIKTLDQLFETTQSLFKNQQISKVTHMAFYIDPQLDYYAFETDEDLCMVLQHVVKILELKYAPVIFLKIEDILLFRDPQFLQLFIRKIIDIQFEEEQAKIKQAKAKNQQQLVAYKRENMPLDADSKEAYQQMIVRNNYRYKPHFNHGSLRYYQCEDYKSQGCKGIWKLTADDDIGTLHLEHSIIYEHHTYFKEQSKGGYLDIALYNQCYLDPNYLKSRRPVLNDDTMFLMNVLKDLYRRNLEIQRKDLIFEMCKNYTVAEKWHQYQNMTDWLIMECRHQIQKELPKNFPTPAAFVDVSHIKTLKHLQFGRDVMEVLILGQTKFMAFFASDWQIHTLKTRIDPNLPQILMVDSFCKLKLKSSQNVLWEQVINIQFLDYTNYQFINCLHCISQSDRSDAVPYVLEWMQKEFGEHVYKPQLILLDGDLGTFDAIHTQYSKHVSLYVPFFGYAHQIWHAFLLRSKPSNQILRVLMFYFKLLPFLPLESVKNRYYDIKRIFQTDIGSDFWFDYERNFLKDDNHIMKWTVHNNEDSRLLYAINRQQEKNMMLIDEQIQPMYSHANSDNLGNLIEGVQRLEKLQKDEFESKKEAQSRWYPQLKFLMTVKANPHIIERGLQILMSQSDQLKYGCGEYLGSENFVEYFFTVMDKEYLQYIDSDDTLARLDFELTNYKN